MNTISDPRQLREHTRSMMIEEIMHITGRVHWTPMTFRQWLESLSDAELAREYEKAIPCD